MGMGGEHQVLENCLVKVDISTNKLNCDMPFKFDILFHHGLLAQASKALPRKFAP